VNAEEAATLRRRHMDLLDQIDRKTESAAGNSTVLVKTVTVSTYPTAVQSFFGVQRAIVSGTEAEGQTPTFTLHGSTFYAANVGSTVPPSGTYVLASLVGGRWEFRYDG